LDAYDCVLTKLDVRNYAAKKVPAELKLKVLEAARLTASGINRQHWRFILIQENENIKTLAADSTSGSWVGKADFAVIVLTDPKLGFAKIDAGRAAQDMQLAAWNFGVVSCIYTGVDEERLRKDFAIPPNLQATLVVGFGYPVGKITGKKKNRKPIKEIAFVEKYGNSLEPNKLC
jgi:nitroreductase